MLTCTASLITAVLLVALLTLGTMRPTTGRAGLSLLLLFTLMFDLTAECNKTHVWNPTFDPHERFHIVWQLFSNAGSTLLSVTLMWVFPVNAYTVKLSGAIALIEPIGFLLASATMDRYDGSFFPLNVPEYDIRIAGVPISLALFGLLAVAEVVIVILVADCTKPYDPKQL